MSSISALRDRRRFHSVYSACIRAEANSVSGPRSSASVSICSCSANSASISCSRRLNAVIVLSRFRALWLLNIALQPTAGFLITLPICAELARHNYRTFGASVASGGYKERRAVAEAVRSSPKRARVTRVIIIQMVGSPSEASGNPPSGAVKKLERGFVTSGRTVAATPWVERGGQGNHHIG